jgi:hypothetical protein
LVVVFLDLHHYSPAKVEIVLKSTQGTESVLHPGKLPENDQLVMEEEMVEDEDDNRWKLSTVRNWGKSMAGDWTLSITDLKEGHKEDCIDAPSFQILYTGVWDTCNYLVRNEMCRNGDISDEFFFGTDGNGGGFEPLLKVKDDKNDRTLQEACYDCGAELEGRITWIRYANGGWSFMDGQSQPMYLLPSRQALLPPQARRRFPPCPLASLQHKVRATILAASLQLRDLRGVQAM